MLLDVRDARNERGVGLQGQGKPATDNGEVSIDRRILGALLGPDGDVLLELRFAEARGLHAAEQRADMQLGSVFHVVQRTLLRVLIIFYDEVRKIGDRHLLRPRPGEPGRSGGGRALLRPRPGEPPRGDLAQPLRQQLLRFADVAGVRRFGVGLAAMAIEDPPDMAPQTKAAGSARAPHTGHCTAIVSFAASIWRSRSHLSTKTRLPRRTTGNWPFFIWWRMECAVTLIYCAAAGTSKRRAAASGDFWMRSKAILATTRPARSSSKFESMLSVIVVSTAPIGKLGE